jgi:hypothetical protein
MACDKQISGSHVVPTSTKNSPIRITIRAILCLLKILMCWLLLIREENTRKRSALNGLGKGDTTRGNCVCVQVHNETVRARSRTCVLTSLPPSVSLGFETCPFPWVPLHERF